MSALNRKTLLCATALLLLMVGSAAHAATLYVNCGGTGPLTSIGAALKVLRGTLSSGPNTINVSGVCRENVLVQRMDRLTLNAIHGASIEDMSGGNLDVVDVDNSHGFTLSGFTIRGGSDAVSCYYTAQCLLVQNTIIGAGNGVAVYPLSSAFIVNGSLQGNTGNGIFDRGDVIAAGVAVDGNGNGATVRDGGRLLVRMEDQGDVAGAANAAAVISNSGQYGIVASGGASVACQGCSIHGSGSDAVHLDVSAAARFQSYFSGTTNTRTDTVIHDNGGYGIYVGDLSSAVLFANSTVTGTGAYSIFCDGLAVTRGAIAATSGKTQCGN